MVNNILFYVNGFCIGILLLIISILTIKQLGHIAYLGAAVVSSLSTLISLLFGTFIVQSHNGSVPHLIGEFAIFSIMAILVMSWVKYIEPVHQASQ